MTETEISIQEIIEKILSFDEERSKSTVNQSELHKISQEIQNSLETIKFKPQETPVFLFLTNSLIDMSKQIDPPLTFDQVIHSIYANEYLYGVFYQIPKSIYPQQQLDSETYKILLYFEENRNKYQTNPTN